MIEKLKKRLKGWLLGVPRRGTPVSSLPSGYTTTHPTHTLKYQIWKREFRISSPKRAARNHKKLLP